MALPEPTTRSPGKLQLIYFTGAIDHVSGVHVLESADITDITQMRLSATAFANAAKYALFDIAAITAWRLTDPDGNTLYEETFPAFISGVWGTGGTAAQSVSLSWVGKGYSAGIGVRSGRTATFLFPGTFVAAVMVDAKYPITPAHPQLGPMLTFLNDDTNVGADFYGSKADYKPYVNIQFNAHYQKRYGL